MKNIPFFTTEFGIASLVLEKIPYTGQAYIVVQKATDPRKLLQECTAFSCAAGAETVYVSGGDFFENYPLHTAVISMALQLKDLPLTDAVLLPVHRDSISTWRDIYNEKMRDVPNAAFLTIRGSEKLLQDGNCYFVYRNNKLLGIGAVGESSIKAIAAVAPGGGRDTLLALCSALRSNTVSLEVAKNNIPAMKLYNSLGFTETGIISKWYKIK